MKEGRGIKVLIRSFGSGKALFKLLDLSYSAYVDHFSHIEVAVWRGHGVLELIVQLH